MNALEALKIDLLDILVCAVHHKLELSDISGVLKPVGSCDPCCLGVKHGLVHDLFIGVRSCYIDGFSCINEGQNEE